jgi:hypothetical protein
MDYSMESSIDVVDQGELPILRPIRADSGLWPEKVAAGGKKKIIG